MAISPRKLTLLRALLIVAAGFWVYAPALQGDWLWDDDTLVTGNTTLRSLSGLWQIWFTAPGTDYWPLTWTFLWVEWHLWGAHPLGYHLCNLALHLTSALLVWRLGGRFGLQWAWIGGLLFAIHPLAVESVAWISEIKNTLSLPFLLLSMLAYLDEDDDGDTTHVRSILFYLAAMLCKTSVVMLPAVLLLYCWWKRGEVTWREIRGTLPYFAIALVLGLITIYFQVEHVEEIEVIRQRGLVARFCGAGTACVFYLGQFLFPVHLVPVYPACKLGLFGQLALTFLLALSLVFLGTQRHGWGRHALLGLGFFLINLAPVVGIIRMAYMNVSWVADHLVYVPLIGLICLVVGALELSGGRLSDPRNRNYSAMLAVVAALLAWKSRSYAGVFVNQERLWGYTAQQNPTSFVAHNNVGNALFGSGHVPEAIREYRVALSLYPEMPEARNNLGRAYDEIGETSNAIDQYELALKARPRFALAEVNLGHALVKAGRVSEAIQHFEHALVLDPHDDGTRATLTSLQAKPSTP